MVPAVILGGHVSAIGVIRSLVVDPSIPVILVLPKDAWATSFAQFSRHIDRYYVYDQDSSIIQIIKEISNEYGYNPVIYPTGTDYYVKILSQFYKNLKENCHLPLNPDNIEKVMNKKYQHEVARILKIPVPKSITFSTSNLDEIKSLEYPIIIKALTRNRFGQNFRLNVLNNNTDLKKFYRNTSKIINKEFDILQACEVIPGADNQLYSYLAYYHQGSPKGELVGRKIFQYPKSFGQASVAENQTDAEDEVKKLGRRLMQHLNYHGLVQIEFKFDKRDKNLKLIEINPRAWSWIRLATDSGVNLPLIQYFCMIGKRWPNTMQSQKKRYYARGDFVIRNTLKRTSGDLLFIIKNIARIGFSKFSIRDPLPEIMFLAFKFLRMLHYKGAAEEASLA